MVKPARAQSIPTPSVPEFSLKFVDNSYDVPPTATSTTDLYNGKTTTTTIPGYHVENLTIEVTIKNQPFPSTLNGNTSNLYYNVRIKGHFGEDWTEQYHSYSTSGTLPPQSSSEYTVLSFPASYRFGDEVDFQVQAILGYQLMGWLPDHILVPNYSFVHESSDWSPTQTFTMPDTSASTSNSPTPTPTVPEFPPLAILPLLIVLLSIVVMLFQTAKVCRHPLSQELKDSAPSEGTELTSFQFQPRSNCQSANPEFPRFFSKSAR